MYRGTIAKYSCRVWGEHKQHYSDKENAEDAWEDFREILNKNSLVILYEAREYTKYINVSGNYIKQEFSCYYYHPIYRGMLMDELCVIEECLNMNNITSNITPLNVELIKNIQI